MSTTMTAALSALTPKPTILLADDHPGISRGVTAIVSSQFDVVAAVSNGKEALDVTAQTNPDVVLADIAMPELDGIRLAKALNQTDSRAKIVFLTAQQDEDYISEAVRIGAKGYVLKRRMRSDLIPALQLALADQYFISPHAFTEASKVSGHTLQFYLEEPALLQRFSELAYVALANGDYVFLFLSTAGLETVRKRLWDMGVDLTGAMARRQYISLGVEKIIPLLMHSNWPEPEFFAAFLGPALTRSATSAREKGVRLTIFSDITATLMRQKYDHQIAVRVEELWNDLIQRYCCVVHCACPVMHICSEANRKTVSELCAEHSQVIPIDRRRRSVKVYLSTVSQIAKAGNRDLK